MATLQVAETLGRNRVVWTDNGIAPYSIENSDLGEPDKRVPRIVVAPLAAQTCFLDGSA